MQTFRRIALPWTGALGLVVLWITVSHIVDTPFIPKISEIFSSFKKNWLSSRASTDLLPSMYRILAGYGVGTIIGLVVGTILGMYELARQLFEPLIEFLRALPKIAIIPVFLVLFGIGETSKVLIIALSAAVPVLLNTMDGERMLEPTLIETSRIYHLTRAQLLGIRLRWALPQIFAGARAGLAVAFIMMVVSEMFATSNGIGYFVLISQRTFDIPARWSGIMVLGLLGYIFSLILVGIERKTLHWYRGYKNLEK